MEGVQKKISAQASVNLASPERQRGESRPKIKERGVFNVQSSPR
jgi:hypothetical protein